MKGITWHDDACNRLIPKWNCAMIMKTKPNRLFQLLNFPEEHPVAVVDVHNKIFRPININHQNESGLSYENREYVFEKKAFISNIGHAHHFSGDAF
jgi:hypothetical protein